MFPIHHPGFAHFAAQASARLGVLAAQIVAIHRYHDAAVTAAQRLVFGQEVNNRQTTKTRSYPFHGFILSRKTYYNGLGKGTVEKALPHFEFATKLEIFNE